MKGFSRSTWARQVALDLFETTWEELIGQPSSVSADDVAEVRPAPLRLRPPGTRPRFLSPALRCICAAAGAEPGERVRAFCCGASARGCGVAHGRGLRVGRLRG